ncbi:MAG: phytanoyl-CoA dioxygenase [Alphaproteobacteria bacterium]|nr:phytanoyl-CoA dioxygenase [Alphaproteobacteria bacterium]MBT4016464.1 phytanoyl-CoA dioxygenase [Alphaproteobacteria bacterium]MBT5158985.1 phytanoyl-CoA dioxygenase [Alphaproteobacteria bacterium]
MPQVNLNLPDVLATDFGEDEAEMTRYREEGTARALAMDNRGPICFDDDGKLDPAILDAYWKYGFYVFTGVVGEEERKDLELGVADALDRMPLSPDGKVDKHGRPALGAGLKGRGPRLVKPLSDPLGGTAKNHGRHPVKMLEPEVPADAPEWVMQVTLGSLQHSEAFLRLYSHPDLLAVAEAVNGPDFTPFNEGLWVKHPRLGGSVAWHQDGWTHWGSADLDCGTHGFNFMTQLYGCDAANGLWVVPGSHDMGKVDIVSLVGACGSDRLPDAVPLICAPGDTAIVNRQAVHGSFANTSENIRVTLNAGFHRRKSVHNVTSGGIHNPVSLYDDAYISRRARMIMYAIDARRQHFPDETPFTYVPLADNAADYLWNTTAKADIRDYNLMDIGI